MAGNVYIQTYFYYELAAVLTCFAANFAIKQLISDGHYQYFIALRICILMWLNLLIVRFHSVLYVFVGQFQPDKTDG